MEVSAQPATTHRALLERGRRRLAAIGDEAGFEAELLLVHALGSTRAALYARLSDPVPAAAVHRYAALLDARAAGRPLAYVTGRREFWSLELEVTEATLVPRADTETLVAFALDVLGAEAADVADLGTGSGAVALALASERPAWRIVATDRSPAALAVARRNAAALGIVVDWREGDWIEGLPERHYALIVANPPYLAADDPHLADPALAAEPRDALVAGPTGLEAIERIVRDAPRRLSPGGWLALEHGAAQGPAVRALLGAVGYHEIRTIRDLGGRERVSAGRTG
jgi:release factor glutamine methyltransferase